MQPPFNKRFFYKVSTVSGTTTSPVAVWKDAIGFPRFEVVLNGGMSEMTVDLARKWKDFGEENDVSNGNQVALYVADRDTGDDDARLLAAGYISGYSPILNAEEEKIRVTVLGNSYRLQEAVVTTSGNGTTQVDFYSQDPSSILSTLVNQFNTTVSGVTQFSTNIDQTGTSVTYSFNLVTYKQALDKILELAPRNWWYAVDADGTIQLHDRQYAAKHNLVVGLHIDSIEPFKNIEDIKNVVYFVGNGIQRVYRNSSSIIQYGEKAEVLQDYRVSLTDTADIIGNAYLLSHAFPEVRTRLTVLDNNGDSSNRGYDIDSFKVGEAVSIIHPELRFEQTNWDEFTWDDAKWDGPLASILSQPMQISKIIYQGDRCVLELTSRQPDVAKRIEDINRTLRQFITDTAL